MNKDPRATAAYNALYAAAGAPAGWSPPLPFFKGSQTNDAYKISRGATEPKVIVIPANTTYLAILQPQRTVNPLCVGAGALGAIDWSTTKMMKDDTIIPTVNGDWIGGSPHDLLQDANAIKNPATGTMNLPTTAARPSLMQIMSTELELQVCCSETGAAIVRSFSPGDNVAVLGPRSEKAHLDVATDHSGVVGVKPEFLGALPVVHNAPASLTPADFCERFGKVELMSGGGNSSTKVFRVHGMPDQHWFHSGVLDTADAADAGFVSAQNNFIPRDSLPAIARNGFFVIQNSSTTTTLTIKIQGHAVIATVMVADDGTRGITALASALRLSSPTLIRHESEVDMSPLLSATMVAETHQEIANQRAVMAVKAGVPRDVAAHALAPKPTGPSHFAEEAVMGTVVGGAAYGTAKAVKVSGGANAAKSTALELWNKGNAVVDRMTGQNEWWDFMKSIPEDVAKIGDWASQLGHFVRV